MTTKLRVGYMIMGVAIALVGCRKPEIVESGGGRYSMGERTAENFYYVEYHWRGGKFDDAVALEEALVHRASEAGVLDYAMGRFPTSRQWQLGFVATSAPDFEDFQGRILHSISLPGGTWAVLETTGNVDYMFRYWRKFKRWLERDGVLVDGPVFEVYPDILKDNVPPDVERGEMRYHLAM